jgi:hypothetical protein
MSDDHPKDKKLEEAILLLIVALNWKEHKYRESCCADEIIGLVNENEEMLVRYDKGEIHFSKP